MTTPLECRVGLFSGDNVSLGGQGEGDFLTLDPSTPKEIDSVSEKV